MRWPVVNLNLALICLSSLALINGKSYTVRFVQYFQPSRGLILWLKWFGGCFVLVSLHPFDELENNKVVDIQGSFLVTNLGLKC